MPKSKLSKEVLKISEGILASLTDLILSLSIFITEPLFDPRFGHSLSYTLAKIDKRMQKINYQAIKRAIRYSQQKGWIKENLELTEEGQRRLKNIFPQYSPLINWDGNWYLVNYDIPEILARKRDILRENLITLGFGRMQNSIFISPYNFLGDVEKIVKELNLTPYVILSISNKVGQAESKILAEKIWRVSEVQEAYQRFISEFKDKENPSVAEVFFKYHSILIRDPKLPKELLPDDWAGEEAFRLYSKLTKNLEGKFPI